VSWSNYIPGTKSIDIGDGISYRPHKHWGMNVYAGEGLFSYNGDASGCLHGDKSERWRATCSRPIVVFQRIYTKGDKQVSAVLSYPDGLSAINHYFWEIYPYHDDIGCFDTEEEMEEAVKEALLTTQQEGR